MKNYYPRIATIAGIACAAAISTAQPFLIPINDRPVQFPWTQHPNMGVYQPIRLLGRQANLMRSGTVIPVVLDTPLTSGRIANGTEVSVTLNASNVRYGSLPAAPSTDLSAYKREDGAQLAVPIDAPRDRLDARPIERYGALPPGTKILGHVVSALRSSDTDLGTFVIVFDRIKTPGGRSYPIDASPFTLNPDNMQKDGSGMFMSNSEPSRIWMPNENLTKGTRFGIRLNRDLDLSKS